MLGNLTATLILAMTMGADISLTAPILEQPKRAQETINATISLTNTNYRYKTSASNNIYDAGNNIGVYTYQAYSISNNNAYFNVSGSYYNSWIVIHGTGPDQTATITTYEFLIYDLTLYGTTTATNNSIVIQQQYSWNTEHQDGYIKWDTFSGLYHEGTFRNYIDYPYPQSIDYENVINNMQLSSNYYAGSYTSSTHTELIDTDEQISGTWNNEATITYNQQTTWSERPQVAVITRKTYYLDSNTYYQDNIEVYEQGLLPQATITATYIAVDTQYEVVDIAGLMFNILGMPFTFISTAFNLELFPGTPYYVNISNLLLGIFALIVFIWIMKKFLGR